MNYWVLTSLKDFIKFNGRSCRTESRYFLIFNIIIGLTAGLIDMIMGFTIEIIPGIPTLILSEIARGILILPNTLNFKPYHINVEIYGSDKDIAYAVYYLAGTIDRDGNAIVPNYRTRASSLMKKEKGKWYEVGSHYSPMHSGSGVKFD